MVRYNFNHILKEMKKVDVDLREEHDLVAKLKGKLYANKFVKAKYSKFFR